MKNTKLFLVLLLIFAEFNSVYGQNTVGVISSVENEVSPGYNLFYSHNQSTTYLIDNEGQKVHNWVDGDNFSPGNSVYLLESGLLVRCKKAVGQSVWGGGQGATIDVVNWDGTIVSTFSLNNDQFRLHHDVAPLPNGNILMIVWERIAQAEAIAAGRDPEITTLGAVYSEKILEWNPISNTIVWEWRVWDHIIQNKFPELPNYGVVNMNKEQVDLNYDTHNGHPDWLHINSIDYNATLDQIVLSVPYFNEFWIIDHSTTTEEAKTPSGGVSGKGGDLLYRWGNPFAYQSENELPQQLFFQHDVHWKDPNAVLGDPDFGKILLFNNRVPDGTSVGHLIQTIDPTTGNYFIDDTQASSIGILNTYKHPTNADLAVSRELSSVQGLTNGNTLMFAGRHGYAYELNPQGEIVWEYRIPLVKGEIASQGTVLNINDNVTFRFKRYPTNFAAFEGHDLTTKGLLEETVPTPPPAIDFNVISGSGDESINTARLQIDLSAATPNNVIVYYTITGTASGTGEDYTLAHGALVIPAGNTEGAINIAGIIDDTLNEADETVVVTLSNPGNATLGNDLIFTYTILDNDAIPTIDFAASSSDGDESISSVNLQVNLSAASGQEVTVDYAVTGTASANGTDYNLVSGTLIITANNSNGNITIADIIDDVLDEENETVIVTISNPVNASLGSIVEHSYTIVDNDQSVLRVEGENAITSTKVDETSSFNLTLYNDGNIDLVITEITYPEGFSGPAGPITIPKSDNEVVSLIFSPLEIRTYSGNVIFTSNTEGITTEHNVSGEGSLVTGIENGNIDPSQVILYPSPTSELLNLDFGKFHGQVEKVIIIDAKGQELFRASEPNDKNLQINVSDYKEGLYITRIVINQNTIIKKFMIKR